MDTLERARTLGGGRRARRRDGVEQPVLDGLERPEQELDDEGWREHLGVLEVEADRCERPAQDLVQVPAGEFSTTRSRQRKHRSHVSLWSTCTMPRRSSMAKSERKTMRPPRVAE